MNSSVAAVLVVLVLTVDVPVVAQTQSQINLDAERSYKKSDNELNRLYKQLLSKFKRNREISKKLRLSEAQWIDYRDSYVTSVYPHDDHSEYGSVFPMCWSHCMESATVERCADLRSMLKGVKPVIKGDVSKSASLNRTKVEKTIKAVLEKNKSDESFIECMEDSQNQWREYRDSQVDALVALAGKTDENTRLWYQSQLDSRRLRELNLWLVGVEEGDVCAGSIPIKSR
ncbi:MAG: DUF1311 domain-containing protein [Cyanobacteria bacterium]|nr:DUF1311 domain-containing protein [Cyanobacteriota bacterium]